MAERGVFISVADPSADGHAALLAAALQALRPGWRLGGVGGEAMRRAGVDLLADTVTRSAMGVAALGRAVEVGKLLARIGRALDGKPPGEGQPAHPRPGLVICIDSWSMNSHVAGLARARGIPVLYYVAPQTWASREGRVVKMRQVIDRLACILPFEEAYFRRHGLAATYVGHPLWDRLETDHTTRATEKAGPVVAVLPGSRRGVVKANWPRLQRVMDRVRQEVPGVRFRVPLTANAAETVLGPGPAAQLQPGQAVWLDRDGRVSAEATQADTEVRLDAIDALLPGCDLALCVSGTAALHVAAHEVPLIVVYHGNPVLWNLIGRWVIRTRTYSLVNLLSGPSGRMTEGRHIAPEYIPWYGSVEPVARHAIRLLRDPVELDEMREKLRKVIAPLARPGATERVAAIAVEMTESGVGTARGKPPR